MELDLKNKEWGEFFLQLVFDPTKGDQNNMSSLLKGNTPLVSAKNGNNGLKDFVSTNNKKLYPKYSLTLNNDGDGGAGISYFQPFNYLLDSHVTSLKPRLSLSKYSLLFISRCITNQRDKFGHGYAINSNRLTAFKIMLPKNAKGEPDFKFMEAYIKQKEENKKQKYDTYINKRLDELRDFQKVKPLEEKKWDEFFLHQVFPKIQRGKRLKTGDHVAGKMPYVSSSATNNGVDGLIGNKGKVRIFTNCLSLANSGSVGATFYQPFSFVASDHVTRLENESFNEFIYLFIASVTKRISEKYTFNREINDKRIKREKILLPIDEKGNPDYKYMENYIKQLEYEKLIKFIEKKTTNRQ
jgi:hypothetical protein